MTFISIKEAIRTVKLMMPIAIPVHAPINKLTTIPMILISPDIKEILKLAFFYLLDRILKLKE